MDNLRLVLDVEVLPGNQGNAKHSLPELMELLARLPQQSQPRFVRGDCDWGTDRAMTELEQIHQRFQTHIQYALMVWILYSPFLVL